ncbi:MAG: DEAD/DEAH box helicase [Candidatus Paceibacterota bacterium]
MQPTFDPTQFINRNPVEVSEEVYVPTHTFADFKIDGRLKKTLAEIGHTTPSPIQDQVIPKILEGQDIVGLAQTGTGKTAAFLIPLIELKKKDPSAVTLILTPTRELALQIDAELQKLAKNFRFYSTVCVGGTAIGPQIRGLRRRNQFIIGTPGRIKDLMERNILPLDHITSVVLDEADRMLDMGFIHDMRTILGELPEDRHTLFFSATMDEKAAALVHSFTKNPVTVSVKKKDVTNSIEQDVVRYVHVHKFQTLVDLLKDEAFKRVIVFGAMKHSVEKLGKELNHNGIPSESIHGNKSHGQRQRSLSRFKSGQVRVLVATDVAARGIHVDSVTHVINYDLPNTFEDYVHRIGRTGRGALRGKALTFIPQ